MTLSQSGFKNIAGAQLYYEVAGAGRPFVLLHGHLLDSGQWDDQFAAFAQRYRVLRYDARGFGQSTLPPAPFAHHEDLYAFLQAFGIQRAILMGCSGGGATIIDFALAYPERVEALILVGAGLSGYQPEGPPLPAMLEMMAARQNGNIDRAVELSLQLLTDGPRRTPEQVDPVARERTRAMTARLFARPLVPEAVPQTLELPALTRLGAIQVPTLVMVGAEDQPLLHTIADLITSQVAGAQKVIIANAGHHPNLEQPTQFNQLVQVFLQGQ